MEDELRYWMNDDTGRVIASEDSPGRLWSEIDFETYDALTRPGAKAVEHGLQRTLLESCEYCDTPITAPNFAYHFCVGRKAAKA